MTTEQDRSAMSREQLESALAQREDQLRRALDYCDRTLIYALKEAKEALEQFSDHTRWVQCYATSDVCEEIKNSDPMMVFKDGQDRPWTISKKPLATINKALGK